VFPVVRNIEGEKRMYSLFIVRLIWELGEKKLQKLMLNGASGQPRDLLATGKPALGSGTTTAGEASLHHSLHYGSA
jgi:hypothetical protein